MDDRDRNRSGAPEEPEQAYFPEPTWGIGGGDAGRHGFGRWGVGWGLQNFGGGPQGYGWGGGWQGGYGPRFGGRFGRGLAGAVETARVGPHAGRGPRGYARSDERIREEINERLTDDPDLDPTEILVTVADREVTLEGEVEDRHSRRLAEDIAWDCSAVRDVHNRLRVNPRAGGFESISPLQSGFASILRR